MRVQKWSLVGVMLAIFASPHRSYAQSAGEILKRYEGLSPKQRQEKLVEGARKEAAVVIYSFTAVDQLTPLLEEFHKKYPFVKPEHYRANASGVFNKFTTEARAGRTLADVLDISAGEAYTLRQMGLVDPYSSPVREGIPKDFLDERGYWAAHYHFVVALGANTRAISASEAPRSYGELLNPKWKGRFSLDPADQDLFGALLLYWGKEKTLDYLKISQNSNPGWSPATRNKPISLARARFTWLRGFTAIVRFN